MLRIKIPLIRASQLSLSNFMRYQLPVPPHGVEAKADDEAILIFDNEEEAISYADKLEEVDLSVSKSSPQKNVLRDVVTAIRNDEFVRTYLGFFKFLGSRPRCI